MSSRRSACPVSLPGPARWTGPPARRRPCRHPAAVLSSPPPPFLRRVSASLATVSCSTSVSSPACLTSRSISMSFAFTRRGSGLGPGAGGRALNLKNLIAPEPFSDSDNSHLQFLQGGHHSRDHRQDAARLAVNQPVPLLGGFRQLGEQGVAHLRGLLPQDVGVGGPDPPAGLAAHPVPGGDAPGGGADDRGDDG